MDFHNFQNEYQQAIILAGLPGKWVCPLLGLVLSIEEHKWMKRHSFTWCFETVAYIYAFSLNRNRIQYSLLI